MVSHFGFNVNMRFVQNSVATFSNKYQRKPPGDIFPIVNLSLKFGKIHLYSVNASTA